jgi:fructuronate reductase
VSPAPIRIVHLGLGAFHRAHQAFYTDQVDLQREWGIAAFTGRRPDLATALAEQDGLYTLIERADSQDTFHTIASIVEAVDGSDLTRLAELVAAPTTAIITLTITEAAYRVRAGALDLDADITADLATLTARADDGGPAALRTIPARLMLALDARRVAGAGPLAIVPCDNLADNAGAIRAAVVGVASRVDPALAQWIEEQVSFVGTCVDRITPASTVSDRAEVTRACGYLDNAPVVTEPFHEWELCGDFPAGRPDWERVGAQFVDDIRPYETRKLWFLNGAHSLLAYLGQLRGLPTVAAAIDDRECRAAVERFWDLAQAHLHDDELDLTNYRQQLLQRFANRRISHQLAQIATDGSVKLRNRVVPLVRAASPADRTPGLLVLAAWIDYLARFECVTPEMDVAATEIAAALDQEPSAQTRDLLSLLEPDWGFDDELQAAVHALRRRPDDATNPGDRGTER